VLRSAAAIHARLAMCASFRGGAAWKYPDGTDGSLSAGERSWISGTGRSSITRSASGCGKGKKPRGDSKPRPVIDSVARCWEWRYVTTIVRVERERENKRVGRGGRQRRRQVSRTEFSGVKSLAA
jgi:hypothetical protein